MNEDIMDWIQASTVLLAILGATWRIEKRLEVKIGVLETKIDNVEKKLDLLNQKVDSIDKRLIHLEAYGEAKEFQEWKLERKK